MRILGLIVRELFPHMERWQVGLTTHQHSTSSWSPPSVHHHFPSKPMAAYFHQQSGEVGNKLPDILCGRNRLNEDQQVRHKTDSTHLRRSWPFCQVIYMTQRLHVTPLHSLAIATAMMEVSCRRRKLILPPNLVTRASLLRWHCVPRTFWCCQGDGSDSYEADSRGLGEISRLERFEYRSWYETKSKTLYTNELLAETLSSN